MASILFPQRWFSKDRQHFFGVTVCYMVNFNKKEYQIFSVYIICCLLFVIDGYFFCFAVRDIRFGVVYENAHY